MKTRSLYVILSMLTMLNMARSAPVLSSLPTASATILLDFDGHDVPVTFWNNGVPFTCLAAAMTDAQITEAFNRVAEDFRPFNVNVTTDQNRYLAAPVSMRMRIVITPTSAWYPGVAGIAYTNSFTWGDDTPAFVFSDRLNNDAKRVAEGISHETGHTLGLSHQSSYSSSCTLNYTYNPGMGIGETSWGPIMGSASSMNTTQWNFDPPQKDAPLQKITYQLSLQIMGLVTELMITPVPIAAPWLSVSPVMSSQDPVSSVLPQTRTFSDLT